ncbi:hypothetical protein F960_03709 [Acinetobacter gerneri DSM 14967 = CIP 107464 = MTCC 9824]|uniref:Uncharacterized protein n=1 Tax=Acinetobacter gerneri DSM 14967 = CIP 107464 = MTCC 9824 TaxID=1120926 RepID=N8ZLB3_9GAMM|nr:hypothetical protein F960_03709 [Acinetobacter gerneri DSM 14967 = CIP 107464 = MTCC 9824]
MHRIRASQYRTSAGFLTYPKVLAKKIPIFFENWDFFYLYLPISAISMPRGIYLKPISHYYSA